MYKTIVVHIDASPRQESRLRAAALLAREHGARLVGAAATGISWVELALLTGSMGAPVPPADFDGLRDSAALRLRDFTIQAARLGVESSVARPAEDLPDYGLLLQSRYADLGVLSQETEDGPGLPQVRGPPEHIALHGVRPVQVVPAD